MERKTCLVTGASGEIGAQIVRQIVAEGWQVILHYNQNKEVINTIWNDENNDLVLSVIQADLSHEGGIQNLIENIPFTVDAYIHASGIAHYGVFQETSALEMRQLFHLHVLAPWMISKALLPHMIKNQFGNIVLISSIWGEFGASGEVIYSSVKGAQNSFVKSLAKEVAPSNIRVNAVSPGFIDTKMNNIFTEEEREEIINNIPAKRLGKPSDIANVIGFLLSEKSSYMNGQIISVNGAWY